MPVQLRMNTCMYIHTHTYIHTYMSKTKKQKHGRRLKIQKWLQYNADSFYILGLEARTRTQALHKHIQPKWQIDVPQASSKTCEYRIFLCMITYTYMHWSRSGNSYIHTYTHTCIQVGVEIHTYAHIHIHAFKTLPPLQRIVGVEIHAYAYTHIHTIK